MLAARYAEACNAPAPQREDYILKAQRSGEPYALLLGYRAEPLGSKRGG